MKNEWNREQLLLMSLQGLSSSQIRAFLEGADAVGIKKIKTRQEVLRLQSESLSKRKRWEILKRQGYWELTYLDAKYPAYLREIYNPPMVLYGIGKADLLSDFCLAMVGTRNPSTYGERCATLFARELSSRGATIVSGLAYGIDSIVHRSTLEAEGKTVAVLGSGIDRIYPVANFALSEKIQETGCLLSEYPPGSRALPYHFLERNRIISGLSRGTLVVEAQKKSGTMITVNHALEQGRDVFCIPGNIDQPRSVGTNLLIQKGAQLVQEPEDIIESYADWPVVSNIQHRKKESRDLTQLEQGLYDKLRQGAMSPNELMAVLPISASDLWVTLTTLEMKGSIIRCKDGRFIRKE